MKNKAQLLPALALAGAFAVACTKAENAQFISPVTGVVMPIGVECREIGQSSSNVAGMQTADVTLEKNTVSVSSIDDYARVEGSNKSCTLTSVRPMGVVCKLGGKTVLDATTTALSVFARVQLPNQTEIQSYATYAGSDVPVYISTGTVCKAQPK